MDNEQPLVRRRDGGAPTAGATAAIEKDLRAMPELEVPDTVWGNIRERLDEDGGTGAPWRARSPIAIAASVAMVAAAVVLVSVHLSTADIEPAGDTGVASDSGMARPDPAQADHAAIIEALMEQSRRAEKRRRAVLAFYSPSAPERLLRAQIGGIDAALNEQMFAGKIEPKSREALLRDRVDLMADLTDIERYRQHEFVRQVSF